MPWLNPFLLARYTKGCSHSEPSQCTVQLTLWHRVRSPGLHHTANMLRFFGDVLRRTHLWWSWLCDSAGASICWTEGTQLDVCEARANKNYQCWVRVRYGCTVKIKWWWCRYNALHMGHARLLSLDKLHTRYGVFKTNPSSMLFVNRRCETSSQAQTEVLTLDSNDAFVCMQWMATELKVWDWHRSALSHMYSVRTMQLHQPGPCWSNGSNPALMPPSALCHRQHSLVNQNLVLTSIRPIASQSTKRWINQSC